jgi:succinoglycan biosynthesis protein ExoM
MSADHITVCICTFKRPDYLTRLLKSLWNQTPDPRYTWSVAVVDNDAAASASHTVHQLAPDSPVAIRYAVEPQQNIARARNRAVRLACGKYLAFIDDDEFPGETWLSALFTTCEQTGSDGVLGPVVPHFESPPPSWLIRSRICERPRFPTGTVLDHTRTRTGNVLLRSSLFEHQATPFDPAYGRTGGEDVDFFRRMIVQGNRFIWCDEAEVYETVPPQRWKRAYHLRRAFIAGRVHDTYLAGSAKVFGRWVAAAKSFAACVAYATVLPVMIIRGEHAVLRYLIKGAHHAGRLSSFAGLHIHPQRNE